MAPQLFGRRAGEAPTMARSGLATAGNVGVEGLQRTGSTEEETGESETAMSLERHAGDRDLEESA